MMSLSSDTQCIFYLFLPSSLTLFCLIKPFKWHYPYFIYSKDVNLLQTPFPVIIGISKNLFKKMLSAPYSNDMFFFDVEMSQLYFNPKTSEKISFFNGSGLKEFCSLHRRFLNHEESRFYEVVIETGAIEARKGEVEANKGIVEEIEDPSKFFEEYFGIFRENFNEKVLSFLEHRFSRVRESFIYDF